MPIDTNNILALDDIVPEWLINQMDVTIPHMPLRFGHRGLGRDEGFSTFSDQLYMNSFKIFDKISQ